jgi:hypothetical protein
VVGYYFRKKKDSYKLYSSISDADGPICEGTLEEVLKYRSEIILNQAKLEVIKLVETFPEGFNLSGEGGVRIGGEKTKKFYEWNMALYDKENCTEALDNKFNEIMKGLE